MMNSADRASYARRRAVPARLAAVAAIVMLVAALGFPGLAQARTFSLANRAGVQKVTVILNNTQSLSFDEDIGTYAVGDPNIVDVLPIKGKEAYLQGKAYGSTNLTIISEDGSRRAVFSIEVTPDLKGLGAAIRQVEPAATVRLSTSNGRVIMAGNVPDASSASRILEVAGTYLGDASSVINALTIEDSQQVMLEVRFLEVSRSIGKEIGVGLRDSSGNSSTTTGAGSTSSGFVINPFQQSVLGASPFASVLGTLLSGGTNVDIAIRALEQKGVTRRLAEPNLVSLSGQEAKFLAGGEYPYSVYDSDQKITSTSFKEYGVRLTFTPTVLRDGIINLKLVPEFSQIDTTRDATAPALNTRRAETMVELRDGQTFVIAGLLDGLNRRNVDQLPLLGDVPVLGALFRSSGFVKNETELMIVVTPRLVKPLAPGTQVSTPLDQMRSSSESDLFLNGDLERKAKTIPQESVFPEGAYGYILDVAE